MAQDDITVNGGNAEQEHDKIKPQNGSTQPESTPETPDSIDSDKPVVDAVGAQEEPVGTNLTKEGGESSASSDNPVDSVETPDNQDKNPEQEESEAEVPEPTSSEPTSGEEATPEQVKVEKEEPATSPVKSEQASQVSESQGSDESESSEDEEDSSEEEMDLTELDKTALIALLTKELNFIKSDEKNATLKEFRRIDILLKEVKPIIEQFQESEEKAAREKYIEENATEEGFEYRSDPQTAQLSELKSELRAERNKFFKQLDKAKEDNFNLKTSLLQRLRELVEEEESKESDDSNMKASWQDFKKIQEEWRAAGNINSPHNGTLWATYNALVDRYFNIRNMFFELKELDRKRNAEMKMELCEKIEAIVEQVNQNGYTRQHLDEALHLFEEYKHVGPAPKEEQEALWQRFKSALDKLYDAKRALSGELKKQAAEVYAIKSKIYEQIVPFTVFSSGSINEWNAKTKELLALQAQWEEVKGGMPREEGKVLSKKFWTALKTFFNNKGEFFRQLEAKREVNLKAKLELCEQAEEILNQGEDTPQNTQKIIDLQKKWKTIGQVPEKYKDSIFARFKGACDAYFDRKRGKSQAMEQEFKENLEKKLELCERIETMAEEGEANIEQLNAFKAEWKGIGFVPRSEMQNIQKKYIAAINKYVSAIGKLSSKEKEIVLLQSEIDVVKSSDSDRNLYRKEIDLRKKVSQLEENILLWQNNIQFFAKSKTSDKLKAEFEKKIEKAEEQLAELKHQLKILQEAI